MGTNYYAEWRPGSGESGSVQMHYPAPFVSMHICKSFHLWQGAVFVSWEAWRHFLTNNAEQITIRDEYDRECEVEEFIRLADRAEPSGKAHPYPGWWRDPAGHVFIKGEFS